MDTKEFINQTYDYISGFFERMDNELQETNFVFKDTYEMQQLSRMISMLNYFQSLREKFPLDKSTENVKLLYGKEGLLLNKLEGIIKQCKENNSIHDLREANKRFLIDFRFRDDER